MISNENSIGASKQTKPSQFVLKQVRKAEN